MHKSNTYTRFLPARNLLFAPNRLDRDLVRDFLFVFSRAEYALKAAGFVSAGRYDEPKVGWRDFAKDIEAQFNGLLDQEIVDAKQYLMEHPPKKQVFGKRGLGWQDRVLRTEQSEAQFLIESVSQVRNNLFHGGKELFGGLAERDRRLISSALIIVAFAISLQPSVSAFFEDFGPGIAV